MKIRAMANTGVILVAALLMVLAGCKRDYQRSARETINSEARQVEVRKLVPATEPFPIHTSGVVISESEITLSFKTGGIIRYLAVEEGESVRKGELLGHLALEETDARVRKAENMVEKARRDLERTRGLYSDSSATLEQVQDRETQYNIAESELQIARFNQQYSNIVAPSDGRILKKYVEADELVSPGTPIYRLGTSADKKFMTKAGIPEREIVRVSPADSAVVRFDAFPARQFTARVDRISAASDPVTGTFEIELALPPGITEFKNGFVAEVTILPETESPYFKIPMDALLESDRDRISFFVTDKAGGSADLQYARPVFIGDDFIAVAASDMIAGKRVITRGSHLLRDGDAIDIITNH